MRFDLSCGTTGANTPAPVIGIPIARLKPLRRAALDPAAPAADNAAMLHRFAALALATIGPLLGLALGAAPASAHIVSDRELVTLRVLPAGTLRPVLAPVLPDSGGAVGANRAGWRRLEEQTPALFALADAAASADSATAERVWKSFELTLRHQRPPGDFDRDTTSASVAANDEAAAVVAWLGETLRGFTAMMNSGLADRFRWRYALALPKLDRSVRWALAAAPARQAVEPLRAERMLSEARMFTLADGIWHQDAYARAAKQAMTAALSLQREDGTFHDDGRASARDQARCVAHLQAVAQYFPTPELKGALTRAAQSLARLAARERNADARREAALALTLYAARAGDVKLAIAAAKLRAAE